MDELKTRLPALNVVHCADAHDFLASLPDESVDMIFTDPPYDRASLPIYSLLFEQAGRLLRPGCFLLTYAGYGFLPEIYEQVPPNGGLDYFWQFIIRHGRGYARYWSKQTWCTSKPVLAFSKGKPRLFAWSFGDYQETGRHNDLHPWGQSPEFAVQYIPHFTLEGEVVCDPFAGSGTFPVACREVGRQFLACEIDPDVAHTANERLAATAKGLTLREYQEGQKVLW